jgi:hypothetical protein
METKNEMITLPDALRQNYLKQMNQFIARFKAECLTIDVDYVQLNTSKPLDFALMQYMAKRSGLM